MSTESLNVSVAAQPARNPLAVVSWALLIVWLGASAASFWFMQMNDWRPFGRTGSPYDDIDVARVEQWYRSHVEVTLPPGTHPKVTLVHVYNPDCRCNRFVEPHLKQLVDRYQSQGVKFLAAPDRTIAAHAPVDLPALSATRSTLAAAGVNSSPAALIFNGDGRLIYYGPYSDSAWCGSTGNLVEPVLDRALSGLATVKRPRASRGCFCGW